MSDLVPHVLRDRLKRLELCNLMEHNPELIVYTLVISRKIMIIASLSPGESPVTRKPATLVTVLGFLSALFLIEG
jgi:hypothetical protein